MRHIAPLFALMMAGIVWLGCQKENPPAPKYVEYLPANEAHSLGQVLFYDKQLSINNSIACASCHKQALAFADDVDFSRGFANEFTKRNSMPIQNLTLAPSIVAKTTFPFDTTELFWDGRESNIQEMVLLPIVNHVEMGIDDLDGLCQKLASISYYPPMFEEKFGTPEVNPERVSAALEEFISSIRSNNTKFDDFQNGTVLFSNEELLGKQLFVNKYNCNACHHIETPNGYSTFGGTFANIGLEVVDIDAGRGGVTKFPGDVGKFKIPSLRNVALTAPYMHDGRYKTLDEVLNHYVNNIKDNENLDPRFRKSDGSILRQSISSTEKHAIIAFLKTLTDEHMITDKSLSNPFKIKPA